MDKQEILNKIKDKSVGMVMEYLLSLGADATAYMLFGKNQGPVKDTLQKISGLLGEDKEDEAIALATTLRPDPHGVGERDEEKLAEDLMEVMRLGLATDADAKDLIKTFKKLEKKSPEVMRRVRIGHAKEANAEIRQNKLATAAALGTHKERKDWLIAAGYFSKTEFEILADKDKKLFGKQAKKAKKHMDGSLQRLSDRFSDDPVRKAASKPARGISGWLNPFRK